MKAVAWISLALAGAVVFGCAHDPARPAGRNGAELERYLPLRVGNQWTYQTRFQGQPQPDLTIRLTAEKNGYVHDDRPQPSRYRYDAEGLRDGNERYLLKRPLEEGTAWMSVADLNTVERYRIVDVDRRVQVPAGVFEDCVVVRLQVVMPGERMMRNDMTFAPDVGIVEVRTVVLEGKREIPQSHLKLESYALCERPEGCAPKKKEKK